jgi:hypothetical protein
MKKLSLILGLILTIAVGFACAVQAADMPVSPVLNPVTGTLYVVNNSSTPQIKIYKRIPTGTNPDWDDTGITPISLPSGSKCYGMAVSFDGTKLYASIAQGSSSKINVYTLDSTGTSVTSQTSMSGSIYWSSTSAPAGMALGGGNRLFVADAGLGRVLVFDTSTNAWVKDITDSHLAGKTNLYGVAVTSTTETNYQIYISRKTSPGEIIVFDYNALNNSYTYSQTLYDAVRPTYLKIMNGKLYVSVNGTDGIDVKVYNANDGTVVGSVKSGVVGFYGWGAFDIDPTGTYLIFKKALDAYENKNKLYKIKTSEISGIVTATETATRETINKADGIAVSWGQSPYADDNKVLDTALSYSPTGAVQVINGYYVVANHWPDVDYDTMKQYYSDGTTVLPAGGSTSEGKVVVKFKVSDPDGDLITPLVHYYRVIPSHVDYYLTGEAVPSGTLVALTLDNLAPGNYRWMVLVKDTIGVESGWYDLEGNNFIITTAQAVKISNLNITRDADAVGSSVTVSWQTDPQGSAVDIYTLTCNTDASGNYTSYFTTEASRWTKARENVTINTYKDNNQVGVGTAKYYKIVPAGHTLTSSDLTSEVVGKFDIVIKQGMNLLSLPLEVARTEIINVLGTQLTGSPHGIQDESDEIWTWNQSTTSYNVAWLIKGMGNPAYDNKWFDPSGNEVSTSFSIRADQGFWAWAKTSSPSPITVVGKVASSPRTISLASGMNLMGSCFPVQVKIGRSGLTESLTGSAHGIQDESDEVWIWNQSTTSYDVAWLIKGMGNPAYDNKWFNPSGNEVTDTRIFEPGRGLWIWVKSGVPTTWNYPKPY